MPCSGRSTARLDLPYRNSAFFFFFCFCCGLSLCLCCGLSLFFAMASTSAFPPAWVSTFAAVLVFAFASLFAFVHVSVYVFLLIKFQSVIDLFYCTIRAFNSAEVINFSKQTHYPQLSQQHAAMPSPGQLRQDSA